MTLSTNIATAPMPFLMVRRMPWPYGGRILLPTFDGAVYVHINTLKKTHNLRESQEVGLFETKSSSLKADLEKKYGVSLSYSLSNDLLDFNKIIVPKEKRGQGVGTKVMKEILRWADGNDIIIALTPSSEFGSAVSMLKKFYAGLGFKANKGRNKDYRTQNTMIRYP